MSDSAHIVDDLQLDRLVDGELNNDERRRLLLVLDDLDSGWRKCALAFLEAQTWGQEFKSLDCEVLTRRQQTGGPSSHRKTRSVLGWFALAAGLMMAFTLGLMLQRMSSRSADDSTGGTVQLAANNAPRPSDTQRKPLLTAAADTDMLTLWFLDEIGEAQSLNVPLVDASELDRKLGLTFRSGVPERFRQQLQERGYRVESRRRYAPFWVGEGQPVLFPVEDTQIVPVNRPVY